MPDAFAVNAKVCLHTASDRIGRITGRTQERAGRVRWEIDFGDRREFVADGNIEVIPEDEDVHSLIQRGAYGDVKHLRMTMTHIRLTGRLADVIYSMEATNTEFFAYQFKPVINFLNSPSNGLLIADEVGLGKTIEAGLIWTEMRARFDADRLLIVVPSVLREKWQTELAEKFGVRAEIFNAEELLARLEQRTSGASSGFAVICSLQGLRPPKGWDKEGADEKTVGSVRTRLAQFLRDHSVVEPLFDCVVMDEAHYMRNQESQSHRLGELLRLVSENMILLSATPIQMRALDMFALLKLIDPQNFQFEYAFEQVLRANEPIIALSGALRRGPLPQADYLELIDRCRCHERFRGNRQLEYMATNPPSAEDLRKPDVREELANRVDRTNLLAQVVNRTRKRFVFEDRYIRVPFAPVIEMTPMEAEFYQEVTSAVRAYCLRRDLAEGFIQTIPQRQMCSSIPAAFRAWTRAKNDHDLGEQVYETGGEDQDGTKQSIAPLVAELARTVSAFADYDQLYREDTKFGTLLKELKDYWRANPNKKVILFSYYKETLRYLKERLQKEGFNGQLLYGGMREKKQDAIDRFRNDPKARILLASEVASEGVDLQFASFLINYDLPWNPMRVEQRIGRIDRIGQQEDRIIIHNYFYADTLDDRIYQRLFERLDIFRNALGDLEAVLGEKVSELTYDLLSHQMTPEEEAERIQQTELAIAHIKRSQKELEQEAMHFAAHGDYVLNQVRAAREMKRYVRGEHLWIYVHDFLNEHYPGCHMVQKAEKELTVEMELSMDARVDLRHFMEKNRYERRTKLISNTMGTRVDCVFSSHVNLASAQHEVVNQHHPLVRFITSQLKDAQRYPLVATRVPRIELPEIAPGTYSFVTKRWSTSGARVVERLVYRAREVSNGRELSADDAERLVSAAVDRGTDAFDRAQGLTGDDVREAYEELVFGLDDEFFGYADGMKMENEDRVDLMERTAKEKIRSQIEKIQDVNRSLSGPRAANISRANEGRIRKLEGHLGLLLGSYEKMRGISSDQSEVTSGVVFLE